MFARGEQAKGRGQCTTKGSACPNPLSLMYMCWTALKSTQFELRRVINHTSLASRSRGARSLPGRCGLGGSDPSPPSPCHVGEPDDGGDTHASRSSRARTEQYVHALSSQRGSVEGEELGVRTRRGTRVRDAPVMSANLTTDAANKSRRTKARLIDAVLKDGCTWIESGGWGANCPTAVCGVRALRRGCQPEAYARHVGEPDTRHTL